MAKELTYVLITPYTIRKSRTGAVLSRLLGRTTSRLVAAQMVGLDADMAEQYAASIQPADTPEEEVYRELIRDYIREHFGPEPSGRPHRALLLVFCGDNARRQLADIVGSLTISCDSGETVRNAFGDLVWNPDGTVRYFEPAVLFSEPGGPVHEELQTWCDFFRTHPALLENVCPYPNPEAVQQTLVLIKPDSWRQQSSRPGAIIDMFSRTGLRIIGCKLVHMSVTQALGFYGPVRDVLRRKLSPDIGCKAKDILEQALNVQLPAGTEEPLAEHVGVPYADDQFERIVEFMTGRRPSHCTAAEKEEPGAVGVLALVYEGEDAVAKIRDVLGPTDPTKAPHGTVRREFGSDVMVNTAHASDGPENAQREMDILKLRETNFPQLVEKAMEECRSHE